MADAVKKEVEMVKLIYESPVEAQAKLMDSAGHTSFDVRGIWQNIERELRER